MNDWMLPWKGGCRCGAVRFQVSAPPLLTMACHCTGCQRMTASAFSLSVAVPSAGFAVVEGEPVRGGLGSGTVHHVFCPRCMSWMFSRVEGMDWFVNLRAMLLDDATWFAPFIETWTREKLAWASTPAVHSFATFPAPEDYTRLTEEFGRRAASAR